MNRYWVDFVMPAKWLHVDTTLRLHTCTIHTVSPSQLFNLLGKKYQLQKIAPNIELLATNKTNFMEVVQSETCKQLNKTALQKTQVTYGFSLWPSLSSAFFFNSEIVWILLTPTRHNPYIRSLISRAWNNAFRQTESLFCLLHGFNAGEDTHYMATTMGIFFFLLQE